ncbi:glycosyltransferase family 4 protein [Henriciella mobilis]|uniref:Glycosyltransferase family 1 protein n=1 Tax=Henriciella mobilis TaxID=2305467 RepID=A0A399RRY5_9PROT|nr:glycosyltransferase family 4 protein [Henriciella mobilis]RIJ32305.1 glycosyltransferase family 1 protein [Henriciella mobilis]
MSDRLVGMMGRIWRTVVPAPIRRRLQGPANWYINRAVFNTLKGRRVEGKGPLVVSGFLAEPFGIGRAGMMTVKGLEHGCLQPRTHHLRPLLETGKFNAETIDDLVDGGVWILHCNPDEARVAISRLRPASFERTYRIGFWAYELPTAPPDWIRTSQLFNEIWVPSQFVADSLKGVRVPVRVMPHFIQPSEAGDGERMREQLGLPQDAFIVAASGDLRSSLVRKNVMGAIDIFEKAFPDSGPARLVIKISGAKHSPEILAAIRDRAARNPSIRLVQNLLSESEMKDFRACWDLFLSPHRSEGFGMVIAETMMLGKPVLATGWSGNMQFMHGLDPMLIDYTLKPVRDSEGVYRLPDGNLWAEPDMDDAAAKLRRFAEDPDFTRQMGQKGRERILKNNRIWEELGRRGGPWLAYLQDHSTGPATLAGAAGRAQLAGYDSSV